MTSPDHSQPPSPPKTLYHYTVAEGIVGIATSHEFWLTDIHHLNDTSEFRQAIELIKYNLIDQCKQHGVSSKIKDELVEAIQRFENIVVFVISFCEHGDSLSLWRGYAKNRIGYSIGFQSTFLSRLCTQHETIGYVRQLVKCIYDPSEQETNARIIAANAVGMLKQGHDVGIVRAALIEKTVLFAPSVKHHSFSDEREWRLCFHPRPGDMRAVKVRTNSSGQIVPFYPMKWRSEKGAEEAISAVVIGPNPHSFEICSAGIRPLLFNNNHQKSSIRPSRSPYRYW